MPSLIPCNQDLIVAITGLEGAALTVLLDIVGQVRSTGSNKVMQSPVPSQTTIIDHIVRDPDKVSFTAIVGCSSCKTSLNTMLTILPLLKRMTAQQVYDATFLNLFWNHGAATNMILQNYSVSQTQKDVQILNVNLNFIAANIQGDIGAPSYRAGGFVSI